MVLNATAVVYDKTGVRNKVETYKTATEIKIKMAFKITKIINKKIIISKTLTKFKVIIKTTFRTCIKFRYKATIYIIENS